MSFPSIGFACSCAEIPSVEQELDSSKDVFKGKVIDIKEVRDIRGYISKSVLFQVNQVWKGQKQSQVVVATGTGSGDCGFNFVKGQEYIVYANESDMYGKKQLTTIVCDRTNRLSDAQEDLKKLGQGTQTLEEVDLTKDYNRNFNYIWFLIPIIFIIVVIGATFKSKRT
jgi:hypothetical protein